MLVSRLARVCLFRQERTSIPTSESEAETENTLLYVTLPCSTAKKNQQANRRKRFRNRRRRINPEIPLLKPERQMHWQLELEHQLRRKSSWNQDTFFWKFIVQSTFRNIYTLVIRSAHT